MAPCYVSSLFASAQLIREILRNTYCGAVTTWASKTSLDQLALNAKISDCTPPRSELEERSVFLAARCRLSSKWLEALPSSQVVTLLDSNSSRVCAGLRLGIAICHPHTCVGCGKDVFAKGRHGLSCKKSQGRHVRHTALNQAVSEGLTKARVPNVKEPNNLTLTDGRRPDGVTLLPYDQGRCIV